MTKIKVKPCQTYLSVLPADMIRELFRFLTITKKPKKHSSFYNLLSSALQPQTLIRKNVHVVPDVNQQAIASYVFPINKYREFKDARESKSLLSYACKFRYPSIITWTHKRKLIYSSDIRNALREIIKNDDEDTLKMVLELVKPSAEDINSVARGDKFNTFQVLAPYLAPRSLEWASNLACMNGCYETMRFIYENYKEMTWHNSTSDYHCFRYMYESGCSQMYPMTDEQRTYVRWRRVLTVSEYACFAYVSFLIGAYFSYEIIAFFGILLYLFVPRPY